MRIPHPSAVLVLACILLGAGGTVEARPSTYSKTGSGAKAIYLLLEDLQYKTHRLLDWHDLKPDTMALVVIAPGMRAPAHLIMEWVQQGGVLVLALPRSALFQKCANTSFGPLKIRRTRVKKPASKPSKPPPGLKIDAYECLLVPSGVEAEEEATAKEKEPAAEEQQEAAEEKKDKVVRFHQGRLTRFEKVKVTQYKVLKGGGGGAQALQLTVGRGKVLLLAEDGGLTNARLHREDLVVLIRQWLEKILEPGDGIGFYEGHGSLDIQGILKRTHLWAFVLHGLLWLLLLYWSLAPRSGDPRPAPPTTRREFSQHARALGHLYQHQKASARVLRQQYKRLLARVLGQGDASRALAGQAQAARSPREMRRDRAALAKLIATRTGRDPDSVESILAQVEYAVERTAGGDSKDVQHHFRLSRALAELQGRSAAPPALQTNSRSRRQA